MGHCNDRDPSAPPPADCWDTGGAISVLHSGAPASVCAVFFWPHGETTWSPQAARAYTASIMLAAHDGIGVQSVVDLSTLAQHISHWFENQYDLSRRVVKPRAVLIVPEDASSGDALPNGHVFEQSFPVFAPIDRPVRIRVFVLGPA